MSSDKTYQQKLDGISRKYEEGLRAIFQEAKIAHQEISESEHLPLILQAVEKILGVAATSIDERQIGSQHINAENKKQELDENGQNTKKKPVRVYLDGCFDIMHSGHHNAVRQAKMLGDILVAGVHSDEEITLHKGPPVMNNEERVGLVKACKWVDEVAFGTPYNPTIALLDELNCDFVVHGDDIPSTADGQEAYGEVRRAGRMKIIKRTPGVSTTDLVGRLLLMTKNHHSSPVPVALSSPRLGPKDLKFSENGAVQPSDKKQKTESNGDSWKQVKNPEPSTEHYAAGLSSFLPTTWRITQFSNNRMPKADDVVVYIDGAFDLFHIGHVETLRKAKELGTFLYVGIHDDKTVNVHKGRNYPIMNLHERVLNVLACKYVDEVVMGAPWEVSKDLLKVLNIQVVVTGSNSKFDMENLSGEIVEVLDKEDPYKTPKEMGIFKVVDTTHQLLTQDVISRIIQNRLKYEKRNASREKKELAYLEKREYVQEI